MSKGNNRRTLKEGVDPLEAAFIPQGEDIGAKLKSFQAQGGGTESEPGKPAAGRERKPSERKTVRKEETKPVRGIGLNNVEEKNLSVVIPRLKTYLYDRPNGPNVYLDPQLHGFLNRLKTSRGKVKINPLINFLVEQAIYDNWELFQEFLEEEK